MSAGDIMIEDGRYKTRGQSILSIIIPTCNRPKQILSCIESIAALRSPKGTLQVIVVDDGSNPPCEAMVRSFQDRLDIDYFYQKNNGPASARNKGAAHAGAPFLVFLDDDCTLPSDWISAVQRHIRAEVILGGRTVNCLTDNLYASTSQVLIDTLYAYYNRRNSKAVFLASNNIIIPKKIFHELKGFCTYFTNAAAEDRDLCDRLIQSGYTLQFVPDITVNHQHDLTFKSFFKQHFSYGCGAWVYHRLRAHRGGKRIRLEPLRFYLGIVSKPFKTRQSKQRLEMSLLLIISQVANIAGYFWSQFKSAHKNHFIR
jgi:glycosyltransferase involved in cell wall biosynthesis